MEKHRVLVNDPRIMEPLEEFLRTVQEVLRVPKIEEETPKASLSEWVPQPKQAQWYSRWW